MLDPYTYILLHKYQRLDRLKQAEQDRLLQNISQPATQLPSVKELSRLFSNWWTHRHQLQEENHLVEGEVVLP